MEVSDDERVEELPGVSRFPLESCCDYIETSFTLPRSFRARKKREHFELITLPQDMGKKVRICLEGGKMVKKEVSGGDGNFHEAAWSDKGKQPRQTEKLATTPKDDLYQESWPDIVRPAKGGKKGDPPREKPSGIYIDPSSGAQYVLSDEGRRKPLWGKPFWHPALGKVLRTTEEGLFLDDDGEPIPRTVVREEPRKLLLDDLPGDDDCWEY